MSDRPDWSRYGGVVSRAGDPLGQRGPQGFPDREIPLGDPTRWGGHIEQHIVVGETETRSFSTGQPIRVQCGDAYARLWQLFGTISADATAWQNLKTLWKSALLVLSIGAGQNTLQVSYDVLHGVAQLCGAYPFTGGGPFWGMQNGNLIACPFYYPPFSPLLPGNAISAHLETVWNTGETGTYESDIALDLLIAPYAIATGA